VSSPATSVCSYCYRSSKRGKRHTAIEVVRGGSGRARPTPTRQAAAEEEQEAAAAAAVAEEARAAQENLPLSPPIPRSGTNRSPTLYVSSSYYTCVLVLLCVLILERHEQERDCMCPPTTIYVSSYYYVCPDTRAARTGARRVVWCAGRAHLPRHFQLPAGPAGAAGGVLHHKRQRRGGAHKI
jgi:hypothetical protein